MVFLSLPLPVCNRHPSCPLGIAPVCARHALPILVRPIHVPASMASQLQAPERPLVHLLRAELHMPEEPSGLRKGLCPFNDRECLGDLGDVGIFVLLSFLESLPLLVEVPHNRIPGHVRRCKRTTYHRVVSNQLSRRHEPHHRFGSEDEWWCRNCRTGGSAWCGVRNSSSRVSKVIRYLFDHVLVKVHEIISMRDPFLLQFHDRCMGNAHLIIVFEERGPLRCSEHHVDL